MVLLRRTVRFCINDGPSGRPDGGDRASARDNTYAAWPAMRGLGRYYEIDVECRGEVNPRTGYFLNIKMIDQAVREQALPILERAIAETPSSATVALGGLLRAMFDAVQQALDGRVWRMALRLCPTYTLTLRSDDMTAVRIGQQYDFAAAHRLNVPSLSERENRDIFGKCNNPAGHGHNYRVEVVVRCAVDGQGRVLDVAALDAAVNEHVIDKLNVDVEQFERLNPSVENIAQVIWRLLEKPVTELGGDVALAEVSVWETEKTVCTYRGPDAVE